MSSADLASGETTPLADLSERTRDVVMIAAGFLVSLALCWARVVDIWTTGNFYDSDDAMRMAQVRDFLGGQGWYDLTQWRLDAPAGSFMHWSRVVDLPLAALMKICQLFAPGEAGERLARILFPLSLQVAALAACAWLARIVLGPRGVAPAIALMTMSGFMLGQFVPGRVDHHAPQIVLLLLMSATMASALDASRARLGVVAAFCAALSLSISIENLLFIVVLFAAPPLWWIATGRAARPLLIWFAVGLGVATPLCFGLFNAPARWLFPACDAFSPVYVAIALAAAGVCGGLALVDRFATTRLSRATAVVVFGAILGAPILLAFAHCLRDPFDGLDPLVRDIWLNNVGEARPAFKHFALFPRAVQTIVIPTLFGLLGLAVALKSTDGVARGRFALTLAMALAGCVGTTFMIRVSTSLAPVALIGCAWIVSRILDFFAGQRGLAVCAAVFASLPLSSLGWALAPSLLPEPPPAKEKSGACLEAASFAPLARLPAGVALASIEVGAYLLAHTPHSVVTASYHRNNHGNRMAIDAFMASPGNARDIARASGARYVFVCPENKELALIAARAPEGLAALLLAGSAPEWLRPIDMPGTPYRAFEVR